MRVAHYASACRGITMGKFVTQTLTFARRKPNKPCDLLDFDKGVFIVTNYAERREHREAEERWIERMNESAYDTSINNCEHIINDILYTTPQTNQADTKTCCSNFIGYFVSEFPICVFLYPILIFIMVPNTIIVRLCAEYQLLGSAFLIEFANTGNSTFDVPDVDHSLIDNVDQVKGTLEEIKDKMKYNLTYDEDVMGNITDLLTNPVVSYLASSETEKARSDLFVACVSAEWSLDAALSFYFFAFGHASMTRYIPDKTLVIGFMVRIISMFCKYVLQLVIPLLLGLHLLINVKYFYPIYILISFLFRFIFTVLFRLLFDTVCGKGALEQDVSEKKFVTCMPLVVFVLSTFMFSIFILLTPVLLYS